MALRTRQKILLQLALCLEDLIGFLLIAFFIALFFMQVKVPVDTQRTSLTSFFRDPLRMHALALGMLYEVITTVLRRKIAPFIQTVDAPSQSLTAAALAAMRMPKRNGILIHIGRILIFALIFGFWIILVNSHFDRAQPVEYHMPFTREIMEYGVRQRQNHYFVEVRDWNNSARSRYIEIYPGQYDTSHPESYQVVFMLHRGFLGYEWQEIPGAIIPKS